MGGKMIEVRTADGVADCYLAGLEEGERRPGVLFVMDLFGLRPHIKHMVDRIADRGFVVLAPNVFYRAGRAPIVPTDGLQDLANLQEAFDKLAPVMSELTTDRMVADADAYLSHLEGIAGSPVAITGYCMGGRLGWEIAAAHPNRVAALGSFHAGGLATDGEDSPHLCAGALKAEIYLGFADGDEHMTPEQIATVESALQDAGVNYHAEVYAGAPHGFTMADIPSYDEDAAERHFTELFALLDRTVR
ncbi:dienelactone hydrolase family protein [Mycolicibacterium stellerae]|uniref:dienelactone hydrolase family protein n=1 Tax=Mycolicibacterium stellerae TaxID=2358193 RepID=UPI0019D1E6F3|nr:dienelactone hydrolase family protein [Mycolicibacterium stellerae]